LELALPKEVLFHAQGILKENSAKIKETKAPKDLEKPNLNNNNKNTHSTMEKTYLNR